MCGLVGVAGNLSADHRQVFNTLLILDSLRGKHSTGVMGVGTDRQPRIMKKTVLPQELMDMAEYPRTVRITDQVLMGHNRYATKGSINAVNAHPFHHGSVVGCHNGTLDRQHLLPDNTQFQVDSDNLVHAIDKLGIIESIKLTSGAYALSLYDQDSHVLSLTRNAERPLFCRWDEKGECIVWASEKWMLDVAFARVGLKAGPDIPINTMKLYSFQLGDSSVDSVTAPVISQLEACPPIKQYQPPTTTATTKKTNVTGIRTSPELGGIKAGDIIDFYAIDMPETKGIRRFVEGLVDQKEEVIVRTFPGPTTPDIMQHEGLVRAKVGAVMLPAWSSAEQLQHQGYVVVDISTIVLIDPDIPEVLVDGPLGDMLTQKEFDKLTTGGCAVCTGNLQFDYDIVHWHYGEALCDDCNDNYCNGLDLLGEK